MKSSVNPQLSQLKSQRGYYYKKILFSVLLSLFAIILILSAVMLFYTQKRIQENNQKFDEMTRSHMQSSIEYMYDSADKVCKQIYASKNAKELMYRKAPQTGIEMIRAIGHMNAISSSVIDVEGYIDSFAIYSDIPGRTYYSRYGLNYQDQFLLDYVKDPDADHKNPILRTLSDTRGNDRAKVLTFSVVDLNRDNTVSNGVFTNINISWLTSKMGALLDGTELKDSCVLLFDKDWDLVTSVGNQEYVTEEMRTALMETYPAREATSLEHIKVGDKSLYVSTIPMDRQEMLIVRVQSSALVNKSRNTFLTFALIAIICCIILAIALARLITDSLYKPIEGLTGRVNEKGGAKKHLNEIELLNQAYESIGTIRDDLDDTKKKIALYETFTALPSEESDVEGLLEMSNLKIDPNEHITLAIVRVDNDEMYDQSDYSVDMARKLTSDFDREIVRLDILTTICIVQTKTEEDRERLIQKATELCSTELDWQTYIIAIGSLTDGFVHITDAYGEVNNLVARRYFAGERAVIQSSELGTGGSNVWSDRSDVFRAEDKLIEAVRSGSGAATIEKALDEYLAQYRFYEYSDMGVFRSHLIQSVKNLIDQVNPMRSIPITPDYKAFDNAFFATSTVGQLKEVILTFIVEIANELRTDKEDKYADLVRLIQEIVEKEYSDDSLCLASISEEVNLSPNYVGKLFKARMGMSVSAYITDVRLTHAAELIENSNLKINVILEHVGFINQSSFYKSFKQKYNVTPKDYIMSIRNKNGADITADADDF